MRVLWVCNIMLPVIAEQLGLPYSNKEGWLTGLAGRMEQEKEADITLGVCFPYAGGKPLKGYLEKSRMTYYGFAEDTVHEETYDAALEVRMKEIVADFQPDLIHVFGTEYGHTLAIIKAFDRPQRTLIGMQGVCYLTANHYLDGIPEPVAGRSLFRDYLRKDNLLQQQEKMKQRGLREIEALKLTGHVTGRTGFDRQAVAEVNPRAKYHFMNETMRSNFYEQAWHYDTCQKHSIFISQGNYPVKGLHFMLRTLPLLLKRYPDIHLYVAGDCIIKGKGILGQIKRSSYGKYLRDLLREGHLEEHVTFTGPLDAEKMREQYMKAHIFASVSTIENSPNSVGEAMLLGVPVISSEVGGVVDMLTDGVEGLLYTTENISALATAITRIFEDRELAERLSEAAAARARVTHDPNTNYRRLLEIYHDINLYQ